MHQLLKCNRYCVCCTFSIERSWPSIFDFSSPGRCLGACPTCYLMDARQLIAINSTVVVRSECYFSWMNALPLMSSIRAQQLGTATVPRFWFFSVGKGTVPLREGRVKGFLTEAVRVVYLLWYFCQSWLTHSTLTLALPAHLRDYWNKNLKSRHGLITSAHTRRTPVLLSWL